MGWSLCRSVACYEFVGMAQLQLVSRCVGRLVTVSWSLWDGCCVCLGCSVVILRFGRLVNKKSVVIDTTAAIKAVPVFIYITLSFLILKICKNITNQFLFNNIIK